ncbi:hypothetical protein C4N9_20445 [Pararhodobacter marinus]|uniref:Uncharacterized protein n=1 Tax=Pararhodobacter marinus TaxID=2184063 RepID=A0A2U2C4J7_9RHOB|nr:hypothetical protein [Pararhodobacter marinus]PWE26808.1 hypothetical protein C4N9_20445 [Pararhodobacter marinus]
MKSFLTRSRWSRVDFFALGFVLMALILPRTFPLLGRVEGFLFPAATDFTITRIETDSPSTTLIWGHLTRVRAACEFRAVAWALDGNGTSVPVIVEHLRGSIARPEGRSAFGPWRLSIAPDQMPATHAVVFHQCPWRPWLTETHLYP